MTAAKPDKPKGRPPRPNLDRPTAVQEALVMLRRPIPVMPGWQRLAECRDADPALFFEPRGAVTYVEARKLCAGCPVRPQCLHQSVVEHFERHGLWAGLSERQRYKVRRALSLPVADQRRDGLARKPVRPPKKKGEQR